MPASAQTRLQPAILLHPLAATFATRATDATTARPLYSLTPLYGGLIVPLPYHRRGYSERQGSPDVGVKPEAGRDSHLK